MMVSMETIQPPRRLTWEQEFQALQALLVFVGNAGIRMRKPGDWYVTLPSVVQRQKNATTTGGCHSGKTPEEAVGRAFDWATSQEWPLEIDSRTGGKKLVQWNGFMWADVEAQK